MQVIFAWLNNGCCYLPLGLSGWYISWSLLPWTARSFSSLFYIGFVRNRIPHSNRFHKQKRAHVSQKNTSCKIELLCRNARTNDIQRAFRTSSCLNFIPNWIHLKNSYSSKVIKWTIIFLLTSKQKTVSRVLLNLSWLKGKQVKIVILLLLLNPSFKLVKVIAAVNDCS